MASSQRLPLVLVVCIQLTTEPIFRHDVGPQVHCFAWKFRFCYLIISNQILLQESLSAFFFQTISQMQRYLRGRPLMIGEVGGLEEMEKKTEDPSLGIKSQMPFSMRKYI